MAIPLLSLLIFSLLGILDSCYLFFIHLTGIAACGIGDCQAVILGKYGVCAGLPWGVWGMSYYVFLFCASWVQYPTLSDKKSNPVLFGASLLGVGISLYLIYLQAHVIGHWCLFCLVSAALTLGISIFSFILFKRIKRDGRPRVRDIWNASKTPLALSLLVIAFGYGMEWVKTLPRSIDNSEVIAEIDGRTLTLGELNQKTVNMIEAEHRALFETKIDAIEALLIEKDAQEKGISREAYHSLLLQNCHVSSAEIETYYLAHKAQWGDKPFAKLEPKIRTYLYAQKSEAIQLKNTEALKAKYHLKIYLKMPTPLLVLNQNPDTAPVLGAIDAPVTLTLFSDFECEFCADAHAQAMALYRQFPHKIRLVHRHFPAPIHPSAYLASAASVCAQKQGKFWEYGEVLYHDQKHMIPDPRFFEEEASKVGLDPSTFHACIDSSESRLPVDMDIDQAKKMGMTLRPAFFVNGSYYQQLPKMRTFYDLFASKK